MSRWKTVLLGLLIFLCLLSGSVVFLVGTTTGLHILLHSAARWVPGLDIAEVKGGWRNLTLKGVKYSMPGVNVEAEKLHLALKLACLKNSEFCINTLAIGGVTVTVDSKKLPPSAAKEKKTDNTGYLSTPWPLTLRNISLHNITVHLDDTSISLGDFSAGISWREHSLTIAPAHIRELLVALPKEKQEAKGGVVQPAVHPVPQPEQTPADILQAIFTKPLLPESADFHFPLNVDVQEITGEQLRLTGENEILINRLQVQAKMTDSQLQLQTIMLDSPQGQMRVHGRAQFSASWPINLALDGTLNSDVLQHEQIKLRLNGALRDTLALDLAFSGPVKMTLKGNVRLAEAGLPLSLHLHSPQLRWPLTGVAHYQIDNLDYRFQGKATDYSMSVNTVLKGEALPPATLTLEGKGNLEQFNLNKLHLDVLQGRAEFSALVNWRKAVSWRSELRLKGINTAKQYPAWPATLDGSLHTRGSLYGGSWHIRVPELKLTGYIRHNALLASGSLYGNSYNQWEIPGIKLALGHNNITVKGSLDKTLALDMIIDAPHLDNTLPTLGGTVKGSLKVRGDRHTPQLLTDLSAINLRWLTAQIGRIKVAGDMRSGKQIAGKLAVRVEQLKQDALDIERLTLNVDGNEQRHQLTFLVQGKPVSGQMTLHGSFDRHNQHWQGNLSSTRFDTPVGEWRLTRTVALDYFNTKQTINIGPHCWQNPHAQLCVPKTIEAGPAGHASVVLNHADLAMLTPFLPESTQLSGVFNGNASVRWQGEGTLPEGNLTLRGSGVKVVQNVQGNALPIAFDTFSINAGLHNSRAKLDWLIHIANNGQLLGNIQIADLAGRRSLSGNVNIARLSLALLNPALMPGEKIAGMLNSQLRLSGDIQQPQLFGQLGLHNLNIDGDFMPVDLTDASMNITFEGMSSRLAGLIQTSQGQINLHGDASWSKLDAWHARIMAKGDKLRITVPPIVRMDVSPDLSFEATPQLINLDGRVDIPWARINVHDVPESATGVSADEVILDNRLRPVERQSAAMLINSNLVIHVGDDVRLDAFGLKAKLNGDLKLVQDKQGLGLNGQITIPLGRFHAYGQDLIVRKGELQFSGPPEQPYLNLEAIRNPEATEDDVTAGIRVTGLADEPKVEIFSDPVKSQQEALSYLLRGQGLNGDGDSNALTSALVGLGVARSGQIMGKIGETFGVRNLSLDTTGVGDSQQVQVSGYVLPGLQVKYGVGIFDSLATLTLRYRLMPKLYMEAVSGLDQALDLLYQFEF
ncbi:translocation/assembly module TamB domain-containing protein [Enterobacteriaceae bacterium LUAb1]